MFGDCIYDGSELGSFLVGLLGIGLWVIAQMPQASSLHIASGTWFALQHKLSQQNPNSHPCPQVLENFRNQSAEGLSIWFLLQWLLGDSLNLLGCVVQGEQLLTTTLLAVYFVASDVVLLGQASYILDKGNKRLDAVQQPVILGCTSLAMQLRYIACSLLLAAALLHRSCICRGTRRK